MVRKGLLVQEGPLGAGPICRLAIIWVGAATGERFAL